MTSPTLHLLDNSTIPLSTIRGLTPALEYLYGTICILCFLLGTAGNTVAFLHFTSSPSRGLCTFLYTCISGVDILICLTVLPMSLGYFNHRAAGMFANPIFCNTWGYVFHSLTLFSVFHVGVLSVTRAYVLLFPLHQIRKHTIVNIVAGQFLAQCVLSSLVFWGGGRYVYKVKYVECTAHTEAGNDFNKIEHMVGMVTYVLPMFPILISCIVSTWKMYGTHVYNRKTSVKLPLTSIHSPLEQWLQCSGKGALSLKKEASVTILIFTAAYTLFNIPMGVCYIFHTIETTTLQENKYFMFDRPGFYVTNLLFNLALPVSSTVNPIIYIVRMALFRSRIIQFVTDAVERLRCSTSRPA